MKEIDQYSVYKEKLAGICDEHNLTYSIQNRKYPFLMVIKPLGGVDAQQTMMEGMEPGNDTGYISPDASLVFAYRDGAMSYKISETFTISDALFSKLKNLFKKLHNMWMMHFFRDVVETSPGAAPACDSPGEAQEDGETDAGDDECPVEFAEFLDETEPAVDGEEYPEE